MRATAARTSHEQRACVKTRFPAHNRAQAVGRELRRQGLLGERLLLLLHQQADGIPWSCRRVGYFGPYVRRRAARTSKVWVDISSRCVCIAQRHFDAEEAARKAPQRLPICPASAEPLSPPQKLAYASACIGKLRCARNHVQVK